MTEILVPADKRLVWYLALEEYVARHITEEQLFFWSVKPTVIFGRHQVFENEVNIRFCEANGISMYRRKSGGGCVYADEGNLMISYVNPSQHSEQVFQHYLDTMASALQGLGFNAVKTEHNDILVGGRKVSGNASFALPTGTIVHGTMLWNLDFDMMQQAITPPREKLEKHGVQSVCQRVVNLSQLVSCTQAAPRSIDELKNSLSARLCSSRRDLTEEDMQAVEKIEKTYLDPAFIRGEKV